MDNARPTQPDLVEEISALKRRIKQLERSEAEHRRLEKEPELSHQKLRLLIDSGPDFFFLKDLNLRYQLVNKANARFFRRDEADILGKTDADLMPEEAAAACGESDSTAIREKRMVVTTEQVEDRVYETRKFPVTVDGIVVGVAGIIRDITERHMAEESLRSKTALLEALTNTSIDGLMVVDENRKRIATNRRLIELLNIPRSVLDDEDDYALLNYVARMVKQPEQFIERVNYLYDHPYDTGREEIELKNGTVFDRYSAPVLGEDGHHYGRIWTFRDITLRKQAENGLRRSEERFRSLVETTSDWVWEIDKNTVYTYASPRVKDILGYEPEEIIGKTPFELMPPHEAGRVAPLFLQIAQAHRPFSALQNTNVRRDGRRVTIETNGVPMFDENGEYIGFRGFDRDVTDHKQAEDALRENEQRYRSLVESTGDWVWEIDRNCVYTYASPRVKDTLGYEPEEITGKKFVDFMDGFEAERVADIFKGIIAERKIFSTIEKTNTCKDKRQVIIEMSGVPMFDDTGRLLGYRGIDRNITERKQLESRFRQSQKMEAIGTLAGGIAHDFNNILMALMGYATILKMKTANGELQTYVEQILTASQKATELVQNLLAFSRQQAINLKPLSINGTITATQKLLQRLVTEDITIKTVLSPDDITVMADQSQIDQILFNLATNARDAMPNGGTLTIATKAAVLDDEFRRFHGYGKPGRYAFLSVSDTGAGMDEATRERAFDPFFTTKEVGKGTGLGLATVYGIVKQHNGYITLYSEPNIGTTFHIYLPAVDQSGKPEETPPPPLVKGGTETILVAEDNGAVRNLIINILRSYGYVTVEAEDGAQAVAQFRANPHISLLILDSVMPKMNGREVYNAVHGIKPDIKVIFTSGYTRDVFQGKGIEDEKFNFLHKPMSPSILLQKVREVLDEGKEAG